MTQVERNRASKAKYATIANPAERFRARRQHRATLATLMAGHYGDALREASKIVGRTKGQRHAATIARGGALELSVSAAVTVDEYVEIKAAAARDGARSVASWLRGLALVAARGRPSP